jgi:hypothetical protein
MDEVTLDDIMTPEGEPDMSGVYEEDAKLGDRLEAWLNEQPEWALMQAMPHNDRQKAMYLLMSHFMDMLNLEPRPGRAVSRKMQAERDHKVSKVKTVLGARSARQNARLEKQRRRAMRISIARAEELAYEHDERRTAIAALVASMEEEAAKAAEEAAPDEATAEPDEA